MFPFRDHNPSRRTPYVTLSLIGMNVLIFISYFSLFGDERALTTFYYAWGLVPAQLTQGSHVHAVVTSMFLHGSLMHIFGNMLFLWIYGDNIEDELGHGKFLLFYLAGGIAAGLAQVAAAPFSQVPMVGASGAIAAVMGGYLLLFPKARVDVLLFIIVYIRVFTVPAWVLLGFWFGLQLVSGSAVTVDAGGVAYWAHAGGFIAGIVMIFPLWRRLGGIAFWSRTDGHPANPETRYQLKPSRVPRVRRK